MFSSKGRIYKEATSDEGEHFDKLDLNLLFQKFDKAKQQ